MHLLNLSNMPILEQLRLEEALLRADTDDWCLINSGASPAIVMGISGKPEKLLNLERLRKDRIPLIKRFSGGGTVYIDPNTVFVTFICNAQTVGIPCQPKPIMEWTETLYKPLFPGFSLKENDYVFGEKKFGGNAQYIQRGRWLHHTSFLWDYEEEKMGYLKLPEKRPKYRQDRPHNAFLCTLRSLFSTKEKLIETVVTHLSKTFDTAPISLEKALTALSRPHRRATQKIDSF